MTTRREPDATSAAPGAGEPAPGFGTGSEAEYVESSRSEKMREAEKLLARRQAELGIGVFVAPDVKRTTFEDLAQINRDEYVVRKRRSGETLAINLKRLATVFAGTRAVALTSDRLQAYAKDRLEQGAASATIRNELNALRHAFRIAKRAGKVTAVPEFPQLDAPNIRTGFFEADDFAALLGELPDASNPWLSSPTSPAGGNPKWSGSHGIGATPTPGRCAWSRGPPRRGRAGRFRSRPCPD